MRPSESGTSLADELNNWLAHSVPRIADLGIQVVELEVGRIVTRAPLGINGNHLGSMYAGTLFGMGEMMGGVVLYPSIDVTEYLPTVKDLTIRFRRPALTDITGTATLDSATLERVLREAADKGRSEYTCDSVLTDTDGQVVVRTTGTYQLLSMSLVK